MASRGYNEEFDRNVRGAKGSSQEFGFEEQDDLVVIGVAKEERRETEEGFI